MLDPRRREIVVPKFQSDKIWVAVNQSADSRDLIVAEKVLIEVNLAHIWGVRKCGNNTLRPEYFQENSRL